MHPNSHAEGRSLKMLLLSAGGWWMLLAAALAVEPLPAGDSGESADYETLPLRGRVVWLGDALARLHDIRMVPEAKERVLVLETGEGKLHPLVEDVRGRSFRKDERFREIDVELLVRRHTGSPFVQVIRIFALREGHKYELDYWCEICSIAMFELKPCDCCQAPIELRRRLVVDSQP